MKTQSALASVIPNKEAWIRGDYARDENDIYMPISSDKACKFCLSGAVQRIASSAPFGIEHDRLSQIVRDYTKENSKYKGMSTSAISKDLWSITIFNDSPLTTWEDIQEVIRRYDTQSA